MAESGNKPSGGIARAIGDLAMHGLREALNRGTAPKSGQVPVAQNEPPVVAQLMIEIRSDGSRTIARGALHDLRANDSAHVHAEGDTPAQLVASLLHSLLSLPSGALQRFKHKPQIEGEAKVLPPRDKR
jgi:hypothetical protein